MKRNRIIGVVAIVILLGCFVGIRGGDITLQNNIVKAADTKKGNFEYTVQKDGTICIDKYLGRDEKVVVPKKIDGKVVTRIGGGAFWEKYWIVEVVLPDTITSIGDVAFCNCSALQQINLPDGLKKMERGAFAWCSSIEKVVIPDGITRIEKDLFKLCRSLKEVEFPDGLEYIGSGAFESTKLESINLPNGLTYIGKDAFKGAPFEVLRIPDSVTYIGEYAFSGTDICDVSIPEGITSIEEGTFSGCISLKNVEIPSSVKKIGKKAFFGCYALEELYISAFVTEIGGGAFAAAQQLENLTIDENNPAYQRIENCIYSKDGTSLCACFSYESSPNLLDSVTRVEEYAFSGCTYIEEVTLPDSLQFIGAGAFENCSLLKQMVLPDTVTELGAEAFSGCTGLTAITLSENLTKLQKGTFFACSSLTSVKLPERVSEIMDCCFSGCVQLQDIVLPLGVKKIGGQAFYGCKFRKVQLPEEIEQIDYEAFSCTDLQEIDIPAGITTLSEGVFSFCDKLEYVKLSQNISCIEEEVFLECSNLKKIEYGGKKSAWCAIQIKKNNPLTTVEIVCEDQTFMYASIKKIAAVFLQEDAIYNGKIQKPSIIVKNSKGNVVPEDCYTVEYTNNKAVGVAKVTVSGLGNYLGSITKAFYIYPARVSDVRLTAKSRSFLVKWKSQKQQSTGYQLEYSKTADFSKVKKVTLKKGTANTKAVTNLKGKETYYVRVRSYKEITDAGKSKKLYGEWSSVKKVTTKK